MPKDLFIAQEMLYFGGNGRLAFEEVIMELGKRKCIPVLLCGLECYSLTIADIKSLDFTVILFLIKLCKSVNMDIINDCLLFFKFSLPNELLQEGKEEIVNKFACCHKLRLL